MGKRRDTEASGGKENPETPRHSPFGVLENLRGSLPPGADRCPATPAPGSPYAGRIVIARERTGRGGKTVTVIRGVLADAGALAALARRMRQSLGTGGSVEGEAIVLGGDQVQRAAAWLRAEGAARIVIGN